MRLNKDGTRNKQDLSIQDYPPLALSPEGMAMWKFLQWVESRPGSLYYDLLPPSAQRVIVAVEDVALRMEVLRKAMATSDIAEKVAVLKEISKR